MKLNVEVDCTPQEPGTLGLPDVQPMQDAVMDRLQKQLVSNIPEALMQSWFNFNPKITEQFQDMFVAMARLGSPLSGYSNQ